MDAYKVYMKRIFLILCVLLFISCEKNKDIVYFIDDPIYDVAQNHSSTVTELLVDDYYVPYESSNYFDDGLLYNRLRYNSPAYHYWYTQTIPIHTQLFFGSHYRMRTSIFTPWWNPWIWDPWNPWYRWWRWRHFGSFGLWNWYGINNLSFNCIYWNSHHIINNSPFNTNQIYFNSRPTLSGSSFNRSLNDNSIDITNPSMRSPSRTNPSMRSPSRTNPPMRSPSRTNPSMRSPSRTNPSMRSPSRTNPSMRSPSRTNPSMRSPSRR